MGQILASYITTVKVEDPGVWSSTISAESGVFIFISLCITRFIHNISIPIIIVQYFVGGGRVIETLADSQSKVGVIDEHFSQLSPLGVDVGCQAT